MVLAFLPPSLPARPLEQGKRQSWDPAGHHETIRLGCFSRRESGNVPEHRTRGLRKGSWPPAPGPFLGLPWESGGQPSCRRFSAFRFLTAPSLWLPSAAGPSLPRHAPPSAPALAGLGEAQGGNCQPSRLVCAHNLPDSGNGFYWGCSWVGSKDDPVFEPSPGARWDTA